MPGMSRCCLTPKDYSILEKLLDNDTLADDLFRRMLRHKLATARIVFPEDIGAGIARLGSRVEFSVDRRFSDNRILTHGDDDVSGLALPVTRPHGLALLGMAEGDETSVERRDGGMQVLRLDRIWFQPEAMEEQVSERNSARDSQPLRQNTVIAFAARRKPGSHNPDNDDPGPAAA